MRTFAAILLAAIAPAAFAASAVEAGRIAERTGCEGCSYVYYAPRAYAATKAWPVVYVFDPAARGAHAAELFRDAAELHGWIVVASNVTRNGMAWDEIGRAIAATSKDVIARFSVDPRRVYAAGLSGGGVVAVWVAERTGAIAGVIDCSGPQVETKRNYDWYGTAGTDDFNLRAMQNVEAKIKGAHRLAFFDGGHRWPPPELLDEAMTWLELQAMRRGTRPRDETFISTALTSDLAHVAGDDLAQFRRLDAIVRTYAGLINVDDARSRMEALRPAAEKLRKEEQRAFTYEDGFEKRLPRILSDFLGAEEPRSAAWLANQLQIASLQKNAAEHTPRGAAARRVLGYTRLQLVMLAQDLDGKQRGAQAAVARSVAARLGGS